MKIIVGLMCLFALLLLSGCAERTYIETPLCEYAAPPKPESYLNGNTDERLVLMASSYAQSLQLTSDCNTSIEKINAKNKALFP